MASRREAQQQKKREKYKQKREVAQRKRREAVTTKPAEELAAGAMRWPLGAAWITAGWYERGAHVHVAISRRRADGNLAAGFYEVDLAERGLLRARIASGYTEERILAEVGKHADEEQGMIEADPVLAAKVVLEGLRFGEAQGHPRPPGADKALALLDDIDISTFREEIRTGRDVPPAPRSGPWGAFVRWLFGGPRPAAAPSPTAVVAPTDDEEDEDDAPTERVG